MRFVLAEPKLLKDSIGVISDLVSDVRMKFDSDKMEIIAMDPANVAMVVYKLLSSSFVEYNVKNLETIVVSLDNLKQILSRSKPSDTIIFELDEKKNRLKIEFKGETSKHFTLSLLDTHEKDQKVPELKFTGIIELNTLLFNEAIDDMDIISDSIVFNSEINSSGLFFICLYEVINLLLISFIEAKEIFFDCWRKKKRAPPPTNGSK